VTDAAPGGAPGSGPGSGATTAVASPAQPPPGRRGRNPWRAAFFALAGVAIIAAVGWALLGDRVFVVRSVTVTGTRLVTPAQVLTAADVPLGTPLMRVDAGAVTRRVEAIRQVASATVTEDWPDHLAIAVTERVPVMAVRMAGGGYDLVDHAGVIVSWAKTRPAGIPVFLTSLSGSALRGDPGVAAVAAVLTELAPSLARSLTGMSVVRVLTGAGDSVVQAQQVTLSLEGGKTVVWGDPSDAAQKNRELEILLRGAVRYADVSAPGTAVTR